MPIYTKLPSVILNANGLSYCTDSESLEKIDLNCTAGEFEAFKALLQEKLIDDKPSEFTFPEDGKLMNGSFLIVNIDLYVSAEENVSSKLYFDVAYFNN